MQTNKQNPFLGLKPYEEKDRKKLYGRDRDLFLMQDRIFSGRTALLFAGSGVGKTSFIKAKIIPELQRQYDIIYHNQWSIEDPLTALVNSIISQCPSEPNAESPSPVGLAYAPLLARLGNFIKRGPNYENKVSKGRCLIILDQFEEIFQYHSHQKYFTKFIDRLAEMINFTECNSRVLFSMREEFLGELSVFDNKIPDLFGNYYRLKCPTTQEAKDIIERTCSLVEVLVDEPKLESLVRELTWIDRVEAVNGDGKRPTVPIVDKDIVAPPYLQIACRGLWDLQFRIKKEEPEETKKQAGENGTDGSVENLPAVRNVEGNGHPIAPQVDRVSLSADEPTEQVNTSENHLGNTFLADYESGDARKMLKRFCEKILASFNTRELSLLIDAFDYLVTKRGAKIAYELSSLAEHMNVKEKVLKPVLLKLSSDPDSRILRARGPDKALWFELYHDMYGPIIDEWRKAYRLKKQARVRYAVKTSASLIVIFALIASAIWAMSHWLWKPNYYKEVLRAAKLEDPVSYRNSQWAFGELSKTWGYGNAARRLWADAWIKRARLAEKQERGVEAFLFWLRAAAEGPRNPDPAVLSQIDSYLSIDSYKYLRASFQIETDVNLNPPIFSADGSMLLSMTRDMRVSRWSISSKQLDTSGVLVADNNMASFAPPGGTASQGQSSSPPGFPPEPTTKIQIQTSAGNLIAGLNRGRFCIWRFDTGGILWISDSNDREQSQSKTTNQSVGYGQADSLPPPKLSISFTPNGRYFTTFNQRSVQVYEFPDKQTVPSRVGRPFDSVAQMVLSPDNHTLLLVLDDGTVQLRDLETGKSRTPDITSKRISSITFSPDGTKFLTREDKRGGRRPFEFMEEPEQVKIWDTASLKPVGDITKLTSPLDLVSFCNDSKTLAIRKSSFYLERERKTNLTIIFARIDTNDIIGTRFITFETPSTSNVNSNGTSILTVADNGIAQLWSLNPSTSDRKVLTDSAVFVNAAIDFYAETLATINKDGIAKYWNGDSAHQIGEQKLSTNMVRPVDSSSRTDRDSVSFFYYQLVVSPGGKYSGIKNPNGHLTVWDIKKGREIPLESPPTGTLQKAISFSRNDDMLAIADSANKISIWQNLQKPLHSQVFTTAEVGSSLVFSRDDKYLASLSEHGSTLRVTAFEVATGKEMKAPSDELTRDTLRFGPNGKLIARLRGENSVLVFDIVTGNRLVLPHSYTLGYLALSPDGTRLLTSTSDGTISLWDTTTGKSITQEKYDFRVLLLRISADGKTAVAFSENWAHVFGITKDGLQYEDSQLMPIYGAATLRDASGRNFRKIWQVSAKSFEISDVSLAQSKSSTSPPSTSDVLEWLKKLSLSFDDNGQVRSGAVIDEQ